MAKKINVTEMFAKAKQKVTEPATKGSSFKSPFLRMKAGNTYKFRLLLTPNLENKVALPSVRYNFTSTKNGWFKTVISPKTAGKFDRDPAADLRAKFYKEGNAVMRDKLARSVRYYANVFVIEDTATPENVGTVKPIELPKSAWDFVEKEMQSEEGYGEAIFSVDAGNDFIVKVTEKEIEIRGKKIKVPNYDFTFARKATKATEAAKVEDRSFDPYDHIIENLETLLSIPSPEEVSKLLKEEFLTANATLEPDSIGDITEEDDEDDAPPVNEKAFASEGGIGNLDELEASLAAELEKKKK